MRRACFPEGCGLPKRENRRHRSNTSSTNAEAAPPVDTLSNKQWPPRSESAAMVAVGFALGRAWRNCACLVWTHADLLEEASLQEFLEGLDGDARIAADSLRGGHCLLDNVSTGGAAAALVEDVLDRCRRFSRLGRPQPSGKHARRIRQDAMRRREARRRADAGEASPSLCRVS